MKKQITYIDAAKFETVIREEGFVPEFQKGFVKVSGAKGRNVYVAKTDMVGRIDVSGFTWEGGGVTELGEKSFGAVTQQVDFSQTEEEILLLFRLILQHMATLPERVIVRGARSPKASSAQGWSVKKEIASEVASA